MTDATINLDLLISEFSREAISWRSQSMTKDGTKAMALAYIDARDVMRRLDQAVTIQGWQDRYEFHGGRTICYLSIKVGGEWITKADGAGDTDVEAEKGAISDAFKRAAVKWGVGRYLYDMPTIWVPCESYQKGDKHYWSRWKEDPWNYVKGKPAPEQATPASKAAPNRKAYENLIASLRRCDIPSDCDDWWKDGDCKALRAQLPLDWLESLKDEFKSHKAALAAKVAGDAQHPFAGG